MLADWAEAHIVLPSGQSARPGRYRNWPYFRDILNDIGDPEVERVTLVKGTRLGFTKGLGIAIAATAMTDAASMILLVPTQDDVRDYVSDEIEPVFDASPDLDGVMQVSARGRAGRADITSRRSTMSRKRFSNGGSLKVLAARAPRNLRRHDAKKLFADEIDAMDITSEGDPILLAERRTMAHADRKIVLGSTPTEEGISAIDRKYDESDKRIFEVPCPHCGAFFEILWPNIRWPEGAPGEAKLACPHCEEHSKEAGGTLQLIDERHKRELVEGGRWRATRPEIVGHHGYRLNALVSLLANASWGKLATEFLSAKRGGPSEMQVFVNTVEARVWRTSLNQLSADLLAERVEDYDETNIPSWVLLLTLGVDVQDERLEATLLGWAATGSPIALAHYRYEGNTLDPATWKGFDHEVLMRKFRHANGWTMKIDAAAIDSGGGEGRTQVVYNFCKPRLNRRIFAIAGRVGARPVWAPAQKVKGGGPLFIVGHDQVKTAVMERLALPIYNEETGALDPHAIRLSHTLDYEWFEQATGELRRIRYVRTRPKIEFEPKRKGQRVEALDCLCYGWAVRQSPQVRLINLAERAARRPGVASKAKTAEDWSRELNG